MPKTLSLFKQLPEDIFNPLSSPNRRIYWSILHHLHNHFFNGQVLAESAGFPKREIIQAILLFLENASIENWEVEEEIDSTDKQQLSNRIYLRLVKTGWLTEETESYRTSVLLAPTVNQLLSNLVDLASNQSVYFGGKVQIIHNTVEQAVKNPADQATAFHEVCMDAVRFSRHMGSIVMRIRDVNDKLSGNLNAGLALKTFFDDFVSQIMVADYKQLKTENHPFRYRHTIIENAQLIRADKFLRDHFINSYATSMNTSLSSAEQLLEKDVLNLINIFSNIDQQLLRIETIKHKLEQRISHVIRYTKKSQTEISTKLQETIQQLATQTSADSLIFFPASVSEPISEKQLYKRKAARKPPKPRSINRKPKDPKLGILAELSRDARLRRHVTDDLLLRYVSLYLDDQNSIKLSECNIKTIEDYCTFLTLSRIPMNPSYFKIKWRRFMKSYSVIAVDNEWAENKYIKAPNVIIKVSFHVS